MTTTQPMAFLHEDGIVAAWNFAKKYAGPAGRIATLPDIIVARLASKLNDLPWMRYFTTATAEYYGIGADGREKLIVAHGVGPLSTLEGIKSAYSWEYKDKDRRRRGGRISADEFLKLEAGEYGHVTALRLASDFMRQDIEWEHPIFVIDFMDYVRSSGEAAFMRREDMIEAQLDLLLLARLGVYGRRFIFEHHRRTTTWLEEKEVPKESTRDYPCIIFNEGASNCPYTTYPLGEDDRYDWTTLIPHPLEEGKAMAHLLAISGLLNVGSSDDQGSWTSLTTEVDCHEWSNNVRLLAVPDGADWDAGIAEAAQPEDVIRQNWKRLMRPNKDENYTPPRFYRIEQKSTGWFTQYPKRPDGERMDTGDLEFRVTSVSAIGDTRQFMVDDTFFLRYNLSQVVAIAPKLANAYTIEDVSDRDERGLTTVTVQFYQADIDTSRRLPRPDEIKQNYEVLMG